jgi:DEAD/DEAH box helicase domain-containing protein
MRRLRRLCSLAGNDSVQFISCSATIDSPDKVYYDLKKLDIYIYPLMMFNLYDKHMKSVFGVDNVKLINIDGAPHGKKEFIIWNPSLNIPMDELSERKGAIAEGAHILEYLLENNIRTIAFCKVRKTCELLMKHLRENLQKKQRKDIMDKVMSYRGGYTAENRRKIESQMFNGELLGIVATNALELGVDIGSLGNVYL